MTLWLKVTADQYELPELVCDSISELSRKTGFTTSYISSAISKHRRGLIKKCKFRRVEIEEGEDEQSHSNY